MKFNPAPGLENEIFSFYNDLFTRLIKVSGVKTYDKLISLWTDFQKIHFDAADSVLQKHSENFSSDDKASVIEKIEAQSVIVEIIDQKTGKLYRRNLPLKYTETDNGVILSGETSDGNPSDITFLSDKALERINDLTGKGPDTPRCRH
jgi:hypothetical protein